MNRIVTIAIIFALAACAGAQRARPTPTSTCAATCAVRYGQPMPGAHLDAAGACTCIAEVMHLRATLYATSAVYR